jgi:aerobic carbon-monoxide dehydrogenase small subunit
MRRSVSIKINGETYWGEVEDRLLLVWFIREVAGLTGTHVGCDTGHCGACTVIVNGRSVKSCSVLAVQANGSQIMTVEGLASEGKPHVLQQSFRENFAVQCGYCTPGLLMSAYYLLSRNPHPTENEITRAIHGNLCRCEGYSAIIRAIKSASEKIAAKRDSE